MVIRIRFAKSNPNRKGARNRRAAALFASLLEPAAVTAFALALWCIGASLRWAGNFAIPAGVFSHWQTWAATAACVQFCASALSRYGRSGRSTVWKQSVSQSASRSAAMG
jgi:hypothetical protein